MMKTITTMLAFLFAVSVFATETRLHTSPSPGTETRLPRPGYARVPLGEPRPGYARVPLGERIGPPPSQEKGGFKILSRSRQVFDNTECETTNSCDLKRVRFLAEDYRIFVDGDYNYGTRLFAWYVTDTTDSLENYAFVQFIKGCQYYSPNENELAVGGVTRNHFNKIIDFTHKDWVIDSIDSDPVYFSTSDSRHFNYKWNTVAGSVNENTEKIYGLEKPNSSELYITDRPGTAFYIDKDRSVKNISLAFKTCLYKTSDVPAESSPENINFATPITCYHWNSSWVYNHNTSTFENLHEISPECNK